MHQLTHLHFLCKFTLQPVSKACSLWPLPHPLLLLLLLLLSFSFPFSLSLSPSSVQFCTTESTAHLHLSVEESFLQCPEPLYEHMPESLSPLYTRVLGFLQNASLAPSSSIPPARLCALTKALPVSSELFLQVR